MGGEKQLDNFKEILSASEHTLKSTELKYQNGLEKKIDVDKTIEVTGTKVSFCCDNCKAKAEKMKDDEKIESIFSYFFIRVCGVAQFIRIGYTVYLPTCLYPGRMQFILSGGNGNVKTICANGLFDHGY